MASYRAFNLLNSEVEVLAVAVDERGREASVAFEAQLSPLPLVAYALAVASALALLLGVRWAREPQRLEASASLYSSNSIAALTASLLLL